MRAIFATVMVIFSDASFWMLLDSNYVQSSFSAISRHIGNSKLSSFN